MKVGIITEYNPFHNGHLYQINTIRKILNPESITVVMSQDIVQRGDFASFDKFWRTRKALENGVDLVVGLPFYISGQSAENFANGAVKLLNSLEIDTLVFGAESKSLSNLENMARILVDQQDNILDKTKELQKAGLSYPKAREKALEFTGLKVEELFKPNNILALEYLKSLYINNFKIKPYLIPRKGSDYNSLELKNSLTSASSLRNKLNYYRDISNNYTPYPGSELADHFQAYQKEELFKAILLKILNSSFEDLINIVGINEDRANQLLKLLRNSTNYNEMINNLKSKNITRTAINRFLINLLLNFTKDDFKLFSSKSFNLYQRVLGFNSKGQELLRNPNLKIITNLAKDRNKLDSTQKKSLDFDLKAATVRNLFIKGSNLNPDYKEKPIIIN